MKIDNKLLELPKKTKQKKTPKKIGFKHLVNSDNFPSRWNFYLFNI